MGVSRNSGGPEAEGTQPPHPQIHHFTQEESWRHLLLGFRVFIVVSSPKDLRGYHIIIAMDQHQPSCGFWGGGLGSEWLLARSLMELLVLPPQLQHPCALHLKLCNRLSSLTLSQTDWVAPVFNVRVSKRHGGEAQTAGLSRGRWIYSKKTTTT